MLGASQWCGAMARGKESTPQYPGLLLGPREGTGNVWQELQASTRTLYLSTKRGYTVLGHSAPQALLSAR